MTSQWEKLLFLLFWTEVVDLRAKRWEVQDPPGNEGYFFFLIET